jgi:hypothetical protein
MKALSLLIGVVAAGESAIPQDFAIIPELLNELMC